MIEAEQLHARILEKLDLTREVEDEELTGIIYQVLQEAGQKEYIPLKIRTALGKELFNAFRKLDLLQDFLEDDEITEVMINGVQSIFYEKHGKLCEAERHFLSREKLEDVIQQDLWRVQTVSSMKHTDRRCEAAGRLPSECRACSGCVERTNRNDP